MKYLTTIFLVFFINYLYCQEISGIVIDSLNKQPIPFAAISSNFNKNAISNEEGKFRIYKDSFFIENDSLFISSIGFSPKAISCMSLSDIQVVLAPKAIELESVEVTNTEKLDVYEIIEKQLTKHKYFADQYSIADIAIWPWVDRHERHQVKLIKYPNTKKWYDKIAKRKAVIRGKEII